MISLLLVFLLYFLSSTVLFSWEYEIQPYGYTLDLPDGWVALDNEDPAFLAFSNSRRTIILQVKSYPGDSYSSAAVMFDEIKNQLAAQGDGAGFQFSGRDAVFSDLSFITGNIDARSYAVFINGADADIFLLCMSGKRNFADEHDSIISSLDSFSLNEARHSPGPVSRFYSTEHLDTPELAKALLQRGSLSWQYAPSSLEASQLFLEREARVLFAYEGNRDEAWKRYYRMIYRDNFYRFKDLYLQLKEYVEARGIRQKEIPRLLLSWLQDFTYERTGTLSDLLCPIAGAVSQSGDCDSRALVYTILLDYFGIDAILMVSSEYSHALAAVDTSGEGARFLHKGKKYLIAELTEQVSLGMIAADMADPSKWLGVSFPR